MRTIRITRLILALGALACSDATRPAALKPARAVQVGYPITAARGATITVQVQVQDSTGVPIPGQIVNFVVASGGGSVYAATSLTDAKGQASEIWTLGQALGRQTLEARAVDPSTGLALLLGTVTAYAADPPSYASAIKGMQLYWTCPSPVADSVVEYDHVDSLRVAIDDRTITALGQTVTVTTWVGGKIKSQQTSQPGPGTITVGGDSLISGKQIWIKNPNVLGRYDAVALYDPACLVKPFGSWVIVQ